MAFSFSGSTSKERSKLATALSSSPRKKQHRPIPLCKRTTRGSPSLKAARKTARASAQLSLAKSSIPTSKRVTLSEASVNVTDMSAPGTWRRSVGSAVASSADAPVARAGCCVLAPQPMQQQLTNEL